MGRLKGGVVSGGRHLSHRFQQLPGAPIRGHAAEGRQLAHERVFVEAVLGIQASQTEEQVLLSSTLHTAEQAREQSQSVLGPVHLDQQRHGELERVPADAPASSQPVCHAA